MTVTFRISLTARLRVAGVIFADRCQGEHQMKRKIPKI
jgi:hypothetical protein